MAKKKYTEEHIEYLRQISPGRYNDEITKMFNKKFNMNITESAIRTLKVKNSIQSNVSTGKKIYTEEQLAYIRHLCKIDKITNKEITEKFNKKFSTNKSEKAIKAIRQKYGIYIENPEKGYFPKGHVPWNKGLKGIDIGGKETQFKKGNIPSNYRPVGSERVNADGYAEIKIADPNTWELKHRIIWKEHNGPIPDGFVVIFGDGDKTNFNIDNLVLVSRAQLLKMNQYNLIQNDADLTRTGALIADLHLKIGEKSR